MARAANMDGMNLFSWFGHGISVATIVGTVVGILPAIAAILAAAWYVLQIYESRPVQGWLLRRRMRKIEKHQEAIKQLRGE